MEDLFTGVTVVEPAAEPLEVPRGVPRPRRTFPGPPFNKLELTVLNLVGALLATGVSFNEDDDRVDVIGLV